MRRFTRLTAAATLFVAALAVSNPAQGSGGSIVGKNDGVGSFDGFCGGIASNGSIQEYIVRWNSGELDPTSIGAPTSTIVCGSHLWVYSFETGGMTYHGACFLRPEDPVNPGYPDLSTTVADDPAAGVYPPGYSDSFAVFGGGAGVAIDSTSPLFLCWQQPPDQPLATAFVCPMLDTTNPEGASNDSLVTDSGAFGKNFSSDWQMDLTVFQDAMVNARFSAHGRQRFPGDKGNSIVYSQRPNPGADPTDDKVAFTLVLDNNTGGPFSSTIGIEADRLRALPPLGKGFKDITPFFVPKIGTPVVLPTGRTVIKGTLRRPIPARFYPAMPIQLPGRVTVTRSGNGDLADTEYDWWGLRNYSGQYDAGTDEIAYLVNSPSFPGDLVAVQFPAIDLPSGSDYIISGASVVGAEFGGTGLAGFDYIELREEDPILTAPNDSPSGLLRSAGVNDGVGEISIGGGGPAMEVVIDLAPDLAVPVTNPNFTTVNYWLKLGLTPGDDFAVTASTVVLDNQAPTRQKTSYFVDAANSAAYQRIGFFETQNYNAEIRLQLDGQLSTLFDDSIRKPGEVPPVKLHSKSIPVRIDPSAGLPGQ